jgi:hypothetical protein
MWLDSELEDLWVWADELQRHGDPWGELVATSLAAEASEHYDHRVQLDQRVAELERDVLQARVGPLLDGFTGIRPIWEHGVLVGLRVIDPGRRSGEAMLERVAALLRLPAARFLWLLRVELWAEDWRRIHDDALPMLLEPDIVARPRVIILGTPPRHVTIHRPLLEPDDHRLLGEVAHRIAEPGRGLLGLIVDQARVELPWARGDGGSRLQAFVRLEARIQSDPTRLSARDRTLLGRALWDRSERVRLRALDCLGDLGVEAAPFVPDLLLVNRAAPRWRAGADAALAKLVSQPQVVARVAHNFVLEQFSALRWLRTLHGLDGRSVTRIVAMCGEYHGAPGWLTGELLAAQRRLVPEPQLAHGFEHASGNIGSASCQEVPVQDESALRILFERIRTRWNG